MGQENHDRCSIVRRRSACKFHSASLFRIGPFFEVPYVFMILKASSPIKSTCEVRALINVVAQGGRQKLLKRTRKIAFICYSCTCKSDVGLGGRAIAYEDKETQRSHAFHQVGWTGPPLYDTSKVKARLSIAMQLCRVPGPAGPEG